MKLIIFMLAITLCIASPSLRTGLKNSNTDMDADGDSEPMWMFDQIFSSAEEEFGLPSEEEAENQLPFSSEEEIIPQLPEQEEEEEEEEGPQLPEQEEEEEEQEEEEQQQQNASNPNAYTELLPSEIQNNAEVQALLSYAIDIIIQKGITSGKIPQSEYDISQIISVAKRTLPNGKISYNCSVQLKDENQVTIMTQFNVTIKIATQDKFLSNWSYEVTSTFSIDESAYTQLDNSEAQKNPQVKSCLDYAIEDVIPNSKTFTLTTVNGVYTQTIKNTVYYKFDVQLDNRKGKTIDLVCTVAYKAADDSRDVKEYTTKTTTVTRK